MMAGRSPKAGTSRFLRGLSLLALTVSVATAFTHTPVGAAGARFLPQTRNEPNFTSDLNAQMRTLWRAITSDSPALGERVFFPRDAYLHMKQGQIPDPAADYQDRLVSLFALEVSAYHHLLTTGPGVTFVRVSSAPSDAAWIAPGACENTIGYWHLPGVRLVFRRGTRIESVRVASLISWRGVWYVVHLGPNPRPANVGTVDDFHLGAGVPGPAGGC